MAQKYCLYGVVPCGHYGKKLELLAATVFSRARRSAVRSYDFFTNRCSFTYRIAAKIIGAILRKIVIRSHDISAMGVSGELFIVIEYAYARYAADFAIIIEPVALPF